MVGLSERLSFVSCNMGSVLPESSSVKEEQSRWLVRLEWSCARSPRGGLRGERHSGPIASIRNRPEQSVFPGYLYRALIWTTRSTRCIFQSSVSKTTQSLVVFDSTPQLYCCESRRSKRRMSVCTLTQKMMALTFFFRDSLPQHTFQLCKRLSCHYAFNVSLFI